MNKTEVLTDEELFQAAFVKPSEKCFTGRDYTLESYRAIEQAVLAKRGEIVVTKNEAGQIVAVTRQDAEGRILEVIAESKLAEKQEPVAWSIHADGKFTLNIFHVKAVAEAEKARLDAAYPWVNRKVVPLYTHPPVTPALVEAAEKARIALAEVNESHDWLQSTVDAEAVLTAAIEAHKKG